MTDLEKSPRRFSDLQTNRWIVLTAENGWWVSNLYTREAVKSWHEANGHEVVAVLESQPYLDKFVIAHNAEQMYYICIINTKNGLRLGIDSDVCGEVIGEPIAEGKHLFDKLQKESVERSIPIYSYDADGDWIE